MNEFGTFVSEFKEIPKTSREQVMKAATEELLTCMSGKDRFGGIRYADMARFLCQYTFSDADERRHSGESGSTYNAVNWKRLAEEINDFIATLPQELRDCCYSGNVTQPKIAVFATFSNRARGIYKDSRLVMTFVLFLCGLVGSTRLNRDYLKLMLTTEERQVPSRLLRALRSRLELPGSEGGAVVPTLGISLSLDVRQDHYDDMSEFVRAFIHGEDGCAHAVIYRPMKSDATKLIKSFMAISPPERGGDDKHSFQFTHIYQSPKVGGRLRLGSGKIIPLEHGVYFIGGQRPISSGPKRGEGRVPYSSMKILAFRWTDIRTGSSVLPGLAMSTNNSGTLIVSRVAMRRTPAQKAKHLNLKPLVLDDLAENLKADKKVEAKALEVVRKASQDDQNLWRVHNERQFAEYLFTEEKDELDHIFGELAQEIQKYANNSPNKDADWRVPAGFVKQEKTSSLTLDDREFMSLLTQSLKGKTGVTYDKSGEAFDLWAHIRMSPLQIE